MIWNILSQQNSLKEKIYTSIGTFAGGTVAFTTNVTFTGELYYWGRAIALMLLGAIISYFAPKILKRWQIKWEKKKGIKK